MGSQKHDPAPCFCLSSFPPSFPPSLPPSSLRPSFVRLLARCRFVTSLSRIPAPMRGYSPGTHELPGAVASRPLDHFSEVPFAPWCFVPLLSVSFLLSSLLPLVSFLSSFGGPAPGGLPRPAACAAGRLASPAADSAGPRADAGSTSSKPWGRGTLPAGEGPRRETQGEVLITVDGAPLDGGCRWRSGTPRRRDRRGATAGQDRSSSRWRSCWQELMRRRPSGSTSRSRGASSRRSRRSAGRWTPATSSVGSKSAAASDGQRRAPGGGRELCAPAAWGRNASARRLYVPPVYADRAGPRKPCLSGFWGSRFLPVMRGARRGRSAPAVSWQRRVRRSTAGRHAGAHPDVDVRALGCLAVGSRPRARSVGGPARPATRARRGAIVVLQHAGRSAARGCSWCGEAGCWCRWGPDRR